jgi:hypothetical protein
MFRSFYMAGFECATGHNSCGEWIDQIACTQHDLHLDEDYRRLREAEIFTAREAIRWPLVDHGLRYDFSTLDPVLHSAERHGIELIYDLFHYGYPAGLDPFSYEFVDRFEDYCHETARYIARHASGPFYFTPVNEPSYFSFAAGEAGLFAPHERGRSYELKVNLARAAIRGIDAIWAACPEARIVNADPLCHVATPRHAPEIQGEVDFFNQVAVFESWDMLCGRLLPELGGSRRHLDVVGINYYWTNQWEYTHAGIPLADDDERLVPLSDLVESVYRRYGGDVCITETAHVGDQRAPWMRTIAREVEKLFDRNIPLRGVCLYPILGMPEWHERDRWSHMGLWDLHGEDLGRNLHEPLGEALREAQAVVPPFRRHLPRSPRHPAGPHLR